MCLSQLEQIANIIQAFATAAALGVGVMWTIVGGIVGAIWTVWQFRRRRERFPRARIEHLIAHRPIGEGKVLLHMDVRISNIGEVLLFLVLLETVIQRVLPLPAKVADSIMQGSDPVPEGSTEVAWPLIESHRKEFAKDECEIEPGESQDIQFDFILGDHVQTVLVYSYLLNERKRQRKLSWDSTTLYDLAYPGKRFSQPEVGP